MSVSIKGRNTIAKRNTTTIIINGIEVQNDLSDFVNPNSINLSRIGFYLTLDCYAIPLCFLPEFAYTYIIRKPNVPNTTNPNALTRNKSSFST